VAAKTIEEIKLIMTEGLKAVNDTFKDFIESFNRMDIDESEV